MTSEHIRFHAAGHLAAAHLLAVSHPEAVALILGVVQQLAEHPNVAAPPQLMDKLAACMAAPAARRDEIAQLEQWFTDPMNTLIEQSGAKL